MLSVYLSASSKESTRAIHWADRLLATGHIRLDDEWMRTAADWTGTDHVVTPAIAQLACDTHDNAIRGARIFWLLAPESPSRGADREFGYACALHRHFMTPFLLVSGAQCEASVFYRSDQVRRFVDDADAFDWIAAVAAKGIL